MTIYLPVLSQGSFHHLTGSERLTWITILRDFWLFATLLHWIFCHTWEFSPMDTGLVSLSSHLQSPPSSIALLPPVLPRYHWRSTLLPVHPSVPQVCPKDIPLSASHRRCCSQLQTPTPTRFSDSMLAGSLVMYVEMEAKGLQGFRVLRMGNSKGRYSLLRAREGNSFHLTSLLIQVLPPCPPSGVHCLPDASAALQLLPTLVASLWKNSPSFLSPNNCAQNIHLQESCSDRAGTLSYKR